MTIKNQRCTTNRRITHHSSQTCESLEVEVEEGCSNWKLEMS